MPRLYRDLEPDPFSVLTPAGAVEVRFDENLHPRDKDGKFTTSGGGDEAEIARRLDDIVGPDGGWNTTASSLTKEAQSISDYLAPLVRDRGKLDALTRDPDYEDVRHEIVATRDHVRDASNSLDKVLAAEDIHDASAYATDAADHLMEADAAFVAVVDAYPDDSYLRDIGNYMGTGLDDLQALSDKYIAERDNQDAGLEDTESAFAGGPYSSHKNY